ncbi:hypothetical protein [Vibrio rhizosphaerae]|uniref:hypothetical protein n=1 Tax=Vibrio rhizosphaerae TaxID=398736 RepID=UPI000ABCCCED|nr:hypothetical protein [Vibrio rhizosphaerae]
MKIKTLLAGMICSLSLFTTQTANSATDVVLIIDTSGSTGALLPTWQRNMESKVFAPFLYEDPETRFGLAAHVDFPMSPYGTSGDYAYKMVHPLTHETQDILLSLKALRSGSGGDAKESQLEAVYQAIKGTGRDLNGNGSYDDLGDIKPQKMGWSNDPDVTKIVIHFTSPLVYHNDPTAEDNYPYKGVVNKPASFIDMVLAYSELPAIYTVTPDPLVAAKHKSAQSSTHEQLMELIERSNQLQGFSGQLESLLPENKSNLASDSASTAEKLSSLSGGKVLHVSSNLSDFEKAVAEVIEKEAEKRGECPVGKTKVELPFGFYCI